MYISKSIDLAEKVVEENTPIDYGWLKYQRRTMNDKELLQICKFRCEEFAEKGASKRLITLSAKRLYEMLYTNL